MQARRQAVILRDATATLADSRRLRRKVQALAQERSLGQRLGEAVGPEREKAAAGIGAAMTGMYDGAIESLRENGSHFAYDGGGSVIAAGDRLYSVGAAVGGSSARLLEDHEGYILHGATIYHRGRPLETRQRAAALDESGNKKWDAPQPLPNHVSVQVKDEKGNVYYSLPDGVYKVPGNPGGQGWVLAGFNQLSAPGARIAKLTVNEPSQTLEVSFEVADPAQAPEPVSLRLDGSLLLPEPSARTPQEEAARWATMAHQLASSYFRAGDPQAWTQAVDHVRYLLEAGKVEEARGAVQGYLEDLKAFPGLNDSDRASIESRLTNLQRQLDDRPDASADGVESGGPSRP